MTQTLRVLSGVQPTGNLHLGNYLGAIRNWVGLQDSHECLFMLADLHAITVPQNPADLTRHTRETAAAYIACGIDPKKSVIFPQSAVSMHAELAWILNCHTPLGWLNRMTQFKEKTNTVRYEDEVKTLSEFEDTTKKALKKTIEDLKSFLALEVAIQNSLEGKELLDSMLGTLNLAQKNVSDLFKANRNHASDKNNRTEEAKLGLYGYPVLMAADILVYHATHVPVGEDQKQHLELARDIAGAFNRAYGTEFFPLPEPLILPTAARVMSLRDGTKKMSKSDPSDYSRITLTDDADAIAKKIRKATSDSLKGVTYSPEQRPEIANLLTIFAALSNQTPQQVAAQFASSQTSAFKAALAELAVESLAPITARMRELMQDTTLLDGILREGAEKARAIAAPILAATHALVGFYKP